MIWGALAVAVLVVICAYSQRGRWESPKPMLEPGDPRLVPAIKRMLEMGDKPTAIAMYRDATGKSEKEAAEAVEAIIRGEQPR
jgi:hypothetical protein